MNCQAWITVLVVFLCLHQGLCNDVFHTEPEDQSAVSGSSITLRCIIKIKAKTVQWSRGLFGLGTARELPGFDRYKMIGTVYLGNGIEEYSLQIKDLQLEDDENFYCQVTTESGEYFRSRIAKVTVLIPPTRPLLPIQSNQVSVILDKPTNVTCRADSGKPKSQITWKKDDIRVEENVYEIITPQPDSKLVDTTGIVTITAQLEDAGKKIECGAWNEALAGKEPFWTQATLNVQYAPIKVTMTHSNPDKTMKEFDDVTFECTGKANPYEITWKWYKDDQLIPDENSNIYRIARISRDYHGSKIKCEATNAIGSTAVEQAMNILYGPKFKDEAKHVSVDKNGRAELKCEADGNPTAEITWTRKGSVRVLHSSSTYVIPNVRDGLFGVYTCTATVIGFYEISRDIYVTENGPPDITSDSTQFAKPGDRALIQCMSISSPKPSFVWSRNGLSIDYASSGRFSAPEEDLPYGRKSTLQIMNTQEEDFGIYNCTVTNIKGTDTLMITLQKTEEVPIAMIVGGAVGGVGVIFIIVIACVVYHKCRHSDNESYAETDSNTEIRKRDKNESPSEMTKSTLMDQWRQDYNYRYSADFDDVDTKGTNGTVSYSPNGYDTERYGTMPTNYTNGHVYTDHSVDDLGPLNRYENSYSTGYIPSTFRSPSRTDYASGRVSVNELASGRVSVNDFTGGRISATDFSGRVSTEPLEPFRLPPADFSTTKLATNV